MFTAYIYTGGVQQILILYFMFFLWFTMIFQKFIQNKHKRKKGNPLKNYPKRSYIQFCEFKEAKYPIYEFKVEM